MNPSTEVRNAVLRLYENMGTGDVSAFERLFSRRSGVLAIGSDPGEWWVGHDTIVEAFKAQLQGSGTRKVEPGDLNAFVEGTVGWAADRRTRRLADGKEIIIREAMLFHQEDGDWKLVQFHASVAVSNGVGGLVPGKGATLMSTREPSVSSLGVIEDLDWWGLKYLVVKLAMEMDVSTGIAAGHGTLEEISAVVGASQRGAHSARCPVPSWAPVQVRGYLLPARRCRNVPGAWQADLLRRRLSHRPEGPRPARRSGAHG